MQFDTIIILASKGLCIRLGDRDPYIDPIEEFHWATFERHPGRKWYSIEQLLRLNGFLTTKEWRAELGEIEWLMYEHNIGGGLSGIDPEYHRVRENLLTLGKKILKETGMQREVEKAESS